MALGVKLELRQSQSLVMTPQLQQAIKLLQLSNMELNEFVEEELERNPILERNEEGNGDAITSDGTENNIDAGATDATADTWLESGSAAGDPAGDLDTDYSNVDPDATLADRQEAANDVLRDDWTSAGTSSAGVSEGYNLEAFVTAELSLHDHLTEQLNLTIFDPVDHLIAVHLIDMVDEVGYMRGDTRELAEKLGIAHDRVVDVLKVLQTFDPVGVCARDLSECLGIQLRDQNRFDPMIEALLDNLDLLAGHNLPALRQACGVAKTELAEMIAEIRELDPKPGLKYGSVSVQPVVPDVIVRHRSDGSWHVELNNETLPRVLVNQSYYTLVSKTAKSDHDKEYLSGCLQTANWLAKSLDQRARTILKVSEEIIRQQDAFLTYGIEHLRPLNLKTVADAISMHESTVSRVTSNKYMETPRGIFELKYFFTSSIPSSVTGEAHSSEAVRHRIRTLVENESVKSVLSDDKIVSLLKQDGIDIARRTVAKYREAMHIPSSVQRRREKKMSSVMAELAL
ncbi:MAG: RNA polymerase factor sigma-54 [Methyloligellaceae bacterium]